MFYEAQARRRGEGVFGSGGRAERRKECGWVFYEATSMDDEGGRSRLR